jgi:hypothetical protein
MKFYGVFIIEFFLWVLNLFTFTHDLPPNRSLKA